ncbi:MAG: hypothetical protein IIA87_01290 [Nanoarchaeota archaeon]|nr:hypothetical protein [Nanoarchaeota archaeon]
MEQTSSFVMRANLPEMPIPCRVYVHQAGVDDVFGGPEKALSYTENLVRIISEEHIEVQDLLDQDTFDYLIAVTWGDIRAPRGINQRVIDFFGFSGTEIWPSNPDVTAWVYREGLFMLREDIATGDTTCGDTLIMLGREEEHRRTTPSLEHYMLNPPYLRGLEPPKTITRTNKKAQPLA